MGILKRLTRAFFPSKHTLAHWIGKEFRGFNKAQDYRTFVESYRGWVYALANKNASSVANTPMKVYRGEIPIEGAHPLRAIMDAPNPEMAWEDVIEHAELSMEIEGNAYLYKERAGGTMFLWPMLPQFTRVVMDKERGLEGYKYGRTPHDAVYFDKADIVHIRFSSLRRDHYYGIGPLEAAFLSVQRLEAMAEHGHSFYKNQARPDVILRTSFGPDSEEAHRLVDQFQGDFQGTRGKPILMKPGDDIEPIGYPPKDLVEVDVAKFTREEIAAIFGVPPAYLEVAKSRAELEAARAQYAQETLLPRCRRIERGLTRGIAREFGAGNLSFRFDNPVPEDKEIRIKERKVNIEAGYSTPNEERERDGLPPIEG